MATKSVITKTRRKKMAEASHTSGKIAKITHIALGSGGVNGDGTVIVPLAENVALKNEVVRKPYTSSTKTSETSYEYTIKLEENELVGVFISEMALIDADGDVVALRSFGLRSRDMEKAKEYLNVVSKRLNKVVIENLDFEKILKNYDKKDALFYLDPPYYEKRTELCPIRRRLYCHGRKRNVGKQSNEESYKIY